MKIKTITRQIVNTEKGEVRMNEHNIGDEVPIADGIYFAPDDAIVVYRGIFVAEIPLDRIFDKCGGRFSVDVNLQNSVSRLVREAEKGDNKA